MSVRMLSRHPSPATASSSPAVSSGSPTFAVAGPSASSSSSAGSASGSGAGLGLLPVGTGGVVVVGAVGRVEGEVAQLLDRILDAQVFVGKAREGEGEEEKERRDEVRVAHESVREERQFYVSGRGRRAESGTRLQETDSGDAKRVDSLSEEESAVKLSGGDRGYGSHRRRDGLKSKSSQLERPEGDAVEAKFGERGDAGKERETRKAGCLQSKLRHYYDEERGVVYVQFTWGSLPLDSPKSERLRHGGLEGEVGSLDHLESEGLRGLLFMFSVCHVILFVQEGARFDPRHLRTFRLLQSAKHSLAPFVKSQVLPGFVPSGSGTRSSPLRPVSLASSNSSGRNGASGRHTSIIALMSGSAPILFPGQCTPVILFVFLEDGSEGGPLSVGRIEDSTESFVSGQASQAICASQSARHVSQPKSLTVTMTRPGMKSEVGFRKKMQTAVENQVRFLLKKCRTVATAGDPGPLGSGVGSGMGPRGPGSVVSNLPGGAGGGALFVLDPSRAVVLVDRSSNRTADALDFVTEALEEMLDGKFSSEEVIGELAGKNYTSGDEIQIIKDFLIRQAEILRGRGGIPNNSAGGSAGVGMVAAAAAAAAASAAAGSTGASGSGLKPLCAPPELPSMATWLTACRLIAEALSSSDGRVSEQGIKVSASRTVETSRSLLKKGSPGLILSGRGVLGTVQSKGAVESALVCLEGGTDLDFKFSAAWCKRVLPSARDVYLKGLPPCYPTSLHKAHLDRAIRAFRIMVRGPAVSIFVAKLLQECEGIWRFGRQLCDAQSLTGKPCIHQVHEVPENAVEIKTKGVANSHDLQEKEESTKVITGGKESAVFKSHSSGVIFLHACACGRSRKQRNDPFDFESANISFFQFPNCENMLPSFVLPNSEGSKPLGGASWSLVRLGNAQYYEPTTGLLQSGFCLKQNLLALWELSMVYRRVSAERGTLFQSGNKLPETFAAATRKTLSEGNKKKLEADVSEVQVSYSNGSKPSTKLSSSGRRSPEDHKMGFSRAVSSGSDMKRAPLEVNMNLNFFADPSFPPLPQRNERQTPAAAAKFGKGSGRDRKDAGPTNPPEFRSSDTRTNNSSGPGEKKLLERPVLGEENQLRMFSTSFRSTPQTAALATKMERMHIYIGFEHECPYGHRFFLSIEHLSRLGPPLAQGTAHPNIKHEPESSGGGVSKSDVQDRKNAQSKMGRKYNVIHGHTPTEAAVAAPGVPDPITDKAPDSLGDADSFFIQECTGEGHTLLGANLPIFMNCPYCDVADDEKEKNDKTAFSGKVSQLQRIFLVTPPLPLLLASCPVVEFEESYGLARKNVKETVKFSLGCELVLPPDSFLSLRLPFVYFTESEDGKREPLLYRKDKPEQTAWLAKGSALFTLTKTGNVIPGS